MRSDSSRLLLNVTGTFVDRAPIDWRALAARVANVADRAFIDSLRLVDEIRREAAAAHDAGAPRSRIARALWVVAWLAAVQTIYALVVFGGALTRGTPVGLRAPQAAVAVAFAAASVLLTAPASRDPRRLFLLAAFICTASTFARGALSKLPIGWQAIGDHLFAGLSLEAFIPAAMWAFAADFPRVHRFTRFDAAARQVARIACTLGVLVVGLNTCASYGLVGAGRLSMLLPNSPTHVFWHAFTASLVPALAAIAIRSRRAPPGERAKVVRFALALILGLAPFLILGLARAAAPGFNDWFRVVPPTTRLWLDAIVTSGLMAAPILSTIAVIVDRPFELRPRTWSMSWRARMPLTSARRHERLARAVERVSRACGPRETMVVLTRELRVGVGAASAHMLVPGRNGTFEDPSAALTTLNGGAAIVSLAGYASNPVDLSSAHPLFELLPVEDREWAIMNDVSLVAAIKHRDGTIAALAALGPKRLARTYDRHDCLLVTAVAAAAGLAWENAVVPDTSRSDQPAYECQRCGLVDDSPQPSCNCQTSVQLASLPHRLVGKFLIERRIGRGGMGVVYMARDLAIDRRVALKTLPALQRRASRQLHDEARAMAALNHEGLATIYGLEMWRGTPVLVVEHFSAGTLAQRLASGPISLNAALDMGATLARALSYMHAQGLLHRDLKPSNIAFSTAGAPKLLDFGLALFTDHRFPDVKIAGTPAYLPPEAFQGCPPSVAFDLWALGVVLREATGGGHPLLNAFLRRALDPDPGRRFQSASEIESALDAVRGSAQASEQ